MQRNWKEIEGKAQNTEGDRGSVHQPVEYDTWPQRVSRMMNVEFDDYPEALAENPADLIDQLHRYIRSVKRDVRTVDEAFKEYRRSHPDHKEETYNDLLNQNKHLEEEIRQLLKANQVLVDAADLRDREVKRLRQVIVELQDRLDGAKIQG